MKKNHHLINVMQSYPPEKSSLSPEQVVVVADDESMD